MRLPIIQMLVSQWAGNHPTDRAGPDAGGGAGRVDSLKWLTGQVERPRRVERRTRQSSSWGASGRHDEICAYTPETPISQRHDMQTLPAPDGVHAWFGSLACVCNPSASVGHPVFQMDRRWRVPFEQGSSMSRGRTGIYTAQLEGIWGWSPLVSVIAEPICTSWMYAVSRHCCCMSELSHRFGFPAGHSLDRRRNTSHRTDDTEGGDTAARR